MVHFGLFAVYTVCRSGLSGPERKSVPKNPYHGPDLLRTGGLRTPDNPAVDLYFDKSIFSVTLDSVKRDMIEHERPISKITLKQRG